MGALGALGAPGRLLLWLQLCGKRGARTGPARNGAQTRGRGRLTGGRPGSHQHSPGGLSSQRKAAARPGVIAWGCGASGSLPRRRRDPPQPHPSPEL